MDAPLPFLFRHGVAVWVAALVLLPTFAVLLVRWRRLRVAWKEARVRRARFGEPVTRLDGAEGATVALAGRLVASGEPCGRFEDGAAAAVASAGAGRTEAIVSVRAERLELVTAGGTVRLEGPIDVVVGEVETRTGMRPELLEAGPRRRIEAAGGVWSSPDPVVLRSVASGAAAIAWGRLTRGEADVVPGGYRTGGGGLRLVAPPVGADGVPGGVRLAFAGIPRRGERGVRKELAAAAAGVVLFGVVFVLAPALVSPFYGSPTLAHLSAATPFQRARALPAYGVALKESFNVDVPTEEAIERFVTVKIAIGACDEAVDVLLHHGSFVRARAIAERCQLPLRAARAAFEAGDFEGAVRAWDAGEAGTTDRYELTAGLRMHLFAGHFGKAAELARRAVVPWATSGDSDAPAIGAKLACLAEVLGTRAGDPRPSPGNDSVHLADGLADEGLARVCRLLDADLKDGPARFDMLPAPKVSWGADPSVVPDEEALRLLLRLEAGDESTCARFVAGGDPLLDPSPEPWRWPLVRASLDRLLGEPHPTAAQRLVKARLASAMASFESSFGAHEEALRWAGIAAAAIHDYDSSEDGRACAMGLDREPFALMTARVQLRAGHAGLARAELAHAAFEGRRPQAELVDALARGAGETEHLDELLHTTSHLHWSADAYRAALRGQGAALGRAFSAGSPPLRLFRLAAFTTHDPHERAALAAAVRWGDRSLELAWTVSGHLDNLITRFQVAELLEDHALVAELAPVLRAWRAALLRRDTAVPLAVVEMTVRSRSWGWR